METLKKYRVIIGGIVLLAIIAGLYFIFDTHAEPQNENTEKTIDIGEGLGIKTSGDVTVKEVGVMLNIPQPSLDRKITFTGSVLPVELQAAVRTRINEDIASLKKNPTDLSVWFALGFEFKQAGDYKSAEEIWLYVNESADKDEASAQNLADLYTNFIKDYPKAETYYKKALAIKPDNIATYNNLFTLYTYLYKTNTSAAADIRASALKKFPDQSAYINSWQ